VYVRYDTGDDRVRGYGTENVEDIALKPSSAYNVTIFCKPGKTIWGLVQPIPPRG
jgi:hypothetical protein